MLNNSIEGNTNTHFLDRDEEKKINRQVDLEIAKIVSRMGLLGAVANIVSGLFFIWVVHSSANFYILISWYSVLFFANVANIFLNQYYKDKLIDPKKRIVWRFLLLLLFAIICLTWGSITLLFPAPSPNYQLSVLAFLLAVVIGFSFPSISDFSLGVISISCLLIPTIIYYLYKGIFHLNVGDGSYPNITFAISSSLVILGLFLLMVTRISSRLVKQFFQLSFANAVLNHKLENINKFLEQRVKERTIELEKTVKQVTHRATHDLLTDLPNQSSLINYMRSAIKLARQNNKMFAVVFFSINEIDRIYNALGYHIGDIIIKIIAKRFQSKYGEPATDNIEGHSYIVTLSRNDTFVILIQAIRELSEVEAKIKPLFEMLEESVYTEKQVIKLTSSVGVSLYPRNGRNITSLLMNADAAMLLAKQEGGNVFKMYKSEINASITQQLALESKLHTALVQSEFILQYQPIIDLRTGAIVGAEALIRWENPTYGRIQPDNFIPLAEANGIIIPLGEWVLRSVCQQIRAWHKEGLPNLKVAVNLSARQLQSPSLAESIVTILKEFNLDPKFVEFELTETAAFRKEVIPVLQKLKAMGFSLSIDDFGTGYSGLTNIKLFTIDKIKIDKSFVQDLASSNDCRAIVSNIISLTKNINVIVVAEGVETKEQLDFLIAHECEMAQGFYFSPAVQPEVFTELIKNNRRFDF